MRRRWLVSVAIAGLVLVPTAPAVALPGVSTVVEATEVVTDTVGGVTEGTGSPETAEEDATTVPVPGVGEVTAEVDPEEPSVTVGLDVDTEIPGTGTTLDPEVEVGLSPSGPSLDVDGGTSGGTLPEVDLGDVPNPVAPGGDDGDDEDGPGTDGGTDIGDEVTVTPPTPTGTVPRVTEDPFPVPSFPDAPDEGIDEVDEDAVADGQDGSIGPSVDEPTAAGPASAAGPIADEADTRGLLLRIFASVLVAGAFATWRQVTSKLEQASV